MTLYTLLKLGEKEWTLVIQHAFTIDVEDWLDGIPISRSAKLQSEKRLERGMERLLALMGESKVRGTFFALGPIAEAYPELIRRLVDEGHELGCHGWSHDLLYQMTPERFREETRRARDAIQAISGTPVTAYRAAYFSITKASFWALEILAELGFKYDSSIFPVQNWRYGIAQFNPQPQRIDTPAGPILEFPISTVKRWGRNWPVSGGAYFRLYPYSVTRSHFRLTEGSGRPVVFYLHPWELDPDHPKVKFHWKAWVTHYSNLRSTAPRLKRLLKDFSFAPLGVVLEYELTKLSS